MHSAWAAFLEAKAERYIGYQICESVNMASTVIARPQHLYSHSSRLLVLEAAAASSPITAPSLLATSSAPCKTSQRVRAHFVASSVSKDPFNSKRSSVQCPAAADHRQQCTVW